MLRAVLVSLTITAGLAAASTIAEAQEAPLLAWFVEARYHRINTHTPIEYVPIAVGYRF